MNNGILMSLTKDIFLKDRRIFTQVPRDINNILYVVKGIDCNEAKQSRIKYNDKLSIMLIDGVEVGEGDMYYDIIPSTTSDDLTFVIYTSAFINEKSDYSLYSKVFNMYSAIIHTIVPINYMRVIAANTIFRKFINIAPTLFSIKSLQEILPGFSKADVIKYFDEYDIRIRITEKALEQIFDTSTEDLLNGAHWEAFEELEYHGEPRPV